MREIVVAFLGWYAITQAVGAAAMPLTLRNFRALPDRGYAFSRVLGIFLVSLVLWLGTSYGLLRNTSGGAWAALLLVALLSVWSLVHRGGRGEEGSRLEPRWTVRPIPSWGYIVGVELLFLVAFAVWTGVRSFDPAISHTEQPMDLMFINGIWSSATYPPRDPWLSGYAISYYYFGYWMISTLAHLAEQPPEIAYNLGQACWFGLLVTASFGVGYNLYRLHSREKGDGSGDFRDAEVKAAWRIPGRATAAFAFLAGLLTAVAVALASNLHVILEWLYAQGVQMNALIRWVDVYNFPEHSQVTNKWYIDSGWSWWWRASRVIEDVDLNGNHIEVIDEFPIFSYVLSDNHPHLLAMPFVLLVVALALNWFSADGVDTGEGLRRQERGEGEERGLIGSILAGAVGQIRSVRQPYGAAGLLVLIAAAGGLIFLNTWDFPPYWLLIVLVAMLTGVRMNGDVAAAVRQALCRAATVGVLVVLGALLLYLPYFLTAQSQAGGILPNLLHPTRLPQFLVMFGHFLLAGVGLLIIGWREVRPPAGVLFGAAVLVVGMPLIFLLTTGLLSAGAGGGADELLANITRRRFGEPWTFLLMGGLTALTVGMLWQRLVGPGEGGGPTTFVLCLFAIGCLLTYLPEFAYLRDNFGNRMNTVFKFYYQSWLLFGIAGAYAIARYLELAARGLGQRGGGQAAVPIPGLVVSVLSLLLIIASLVYPVAGAYAKIKGSGTRVPTLNGLAYVGEDELAVIDWIRRNTRPESVVLEAKGASYRISSARISAATGRATLLGWDGHEAQWRGRAYGEMAAGRADAIQTLYRFPRPSTLEEALDRWKIDYVLVGPEERAQYGITPLLESRLGQVLEVAFEQGGYRVYRAEGASEK
ncbi:MAG: DUF2298 domain-containing protein [Caldilineaceae bacterium]|nr:DUF2298 domain-containing protein [Caldilineaceae bacterium]